MRLLLTGATGLIGTHLLRRLALRGDSVVALVRDPERARSNAPGAAEYVRWSAGSRSNDLPALLDGADAVVNMAGAPAITRWTERARATIRESRVEGTRSLVEAMARCTQPPGVLVSASAVGYYGLAPNGPVDESSGAGEDFLAQTCRAWEAEAVRAEEFGVRVVLVRTGLVLSTEGGVLASLLPLFRSFVGGPLGSGEQPFPWIHIDDEIEILLWSLDGYTVRGPVNAVAPGIVAYRTFARALADLLRRPSWLRVPAWALRLMLGKAAEMLLGGQEALPRRTLELGYRFRYDALEPALRALLRREEG